MAAPSPPAAIKPLQPCNRRRRRRLPARLPLSPDRPARALPPGADVQREQKKAEKLIKEAAKRNDLVSAKVRAGGAGVRPSGVRAWARLAPSHAAAAAACRSSPRRWWACGAP